MVKRYMMEDQIFCVDQYALMVEEEDGEYVMADDYKKLQELFLKMHASASNHYGDEDSVLNEYKKLVGEE